MAENIALFDMDGSLAAYDQQLLQDLKELSSPYEPEIENVHNLPSWLEKRASFIKKQPGWWLSLPRIERGFEVLRAAAEVGFRNEILTKGPRYSTNAWTEKLLWCQREIDKDINVTITFSKGLVYGKVLFDDFPDYMLEWLKWRKNGLGIMLDNPHNQGFSHPNVIRYDGSNLGEVVRGLKIAFNRQTGDKLGL